MTVLNIPSDGSFNVLIVLFRVLWAYGSMPAKDLLSLCRAGAEADPARLRQTLKRWTDLGLFAEDEEEVRLAPDVVNGGRLSRDIGAATTALPGLVRRIIFREENNERFWDSQGARSADLTRGLAWLLAQDIYSADLSKHATVQELEARQVEERDRWIVRNNVRWGGLLSWGIYLGFLWCADAPLIDPTAALRQDLPLILSQNTELPAASFGQRVAAVLPVLDGGRYRKEVEDTLNPASWQRPAQPELLSTALSRALWRLDAQGILVLESRADTGDSRVLQRMGGQHWRRFTHVRLTTKAA